MCPIGCPGSTLRARGGGGGGSSGRSCCRGGGRGQCTEGLQSGCGKRCGCGLGLALAGYGLAAYCLLGPRGPLPGCKSRCLCGDTVTQAVAVCCGLCCCGGVSFSPWFNLCVHCLNKPWFNLCCRCFTLPLVQPLLSPPKKRPVIAAPGEGSEKKRRGSGFLT